MNDFGLGGAQKVFIADANDLAQKGFDVYIATLFFSSEKNKVDRSSSIELSEDHIFQINGTYFLRRVINLFRLIRSCGADTVISTMDFSNAVTRVAALLFFKTGPNFIIREANTADKKSLKFKLLDIVTYPFIDKIVSVANNVDVSLRSYMPWMGKKAALLYNGVEIKPSSLTMLKEAEMGTSEINILSVGTLFKKKNHQLLLRAFAYSSKAFTLQDKEYSVKLFIVGDGECRSELENLSVALDISDKVEFVGALKPEDVGWYYNRTSILVQSSLREGFPNVILEAMLHRIPVIATNVGGVTDVVLDGETGIVVPSGDVDALAGAITRLLSSDSDRLRMGEAGYQRLNRHFTQEKHIEKLIQLVKET